MGKFYHHLMLVFLPISVLLLSGCFDPTTQYQTGRDNFIEGDYHQAFRKLEPSAQQGNTEAQYAIGYMYFYGLGTIQDQQLALQWIRAAAEKGQPQARQALADLQHTPQGNMRAFSIQRPGALNSSGQSRHMPRRNYRANRATDTYSEPGASSSSSAPAGDQPLRAAWPATGQTQKKAPALDFTQPPPLTKPPATPPVAPRPSGMDLSEGQVKIQQTQQVASTHKVTDIKGRYTVQIAGSYDINRLEDYIHSNQLQGKVQKYKTSRNGENWYVLGYGQYPSKDTAHKAMEGLPSSVIQSSPWVRRMANLEQMQSKLG